MKVAFVFDVNRVYGAEGLGMRLALAASKHHEVALIFLKGDAADSSNFILGEKSDYLNLGLGIINLPQNIRILRRSLSKIEPDLIFSFLTFPNLLTFLSYNSKRSRLIPTEHGFPRRDRRLSIFYKVLGHVCYSKCGVFSISNSVAIQLQDYFCLSPNLVKSLPANVSAQFLDTKFLAHARRRGAKSKTLLFVGRFDDNKRPLLAISLLLDKRLAEWTLTLVGNGPLEADAKQFVVENNLSSRVAFWGYSNNVEKFMTTHQILLHTSVEEGLGLVLIEAAACGMEIVSTANGGSIELLEKLGVGFSLNPICRRDEIVKKILQIESSSSLRGSVDSKLISTYSPENAWNSIESNL